jgi:hypothetical protein
MTDKQLLTVAMACGIAAGLWELYQAITFVEDIRRGSTNVVRGVFIFVLPVLMIVAGIAIRYFDIVIGSGALMPLMGLQHYLIELQPRHFLALALALAATFAGMTVQRRHDREALRKEEQEAIKRAAAAAAR